jgi:DNA-damage-inducible protein J
MMETKIQARIDNGLKENVKNILSRLGLSESQAIRLFYHQIELRKALPFEVKVPNAETVSAIEELEAGKGKKYSSVNELLSSV